MQLHSSDAWLSNTGSSLEWRWHGQCCPFFHQSRQDYSKLCFLVIIRNMLTKSMAYTQPPPPPLPSNPFPFFQLHHFLFALCATELCCKSRSILKGSVIILFLLSFLFTTQTRNHCMRLCEILKSAFFYPFNITVLSSFVHTSFWSSPLDYQTLRVHPKSQNMTKPYLSCEVKCQRPTHAKTPRV